MGSTMFLSSNKPCSTTQLCLNMDIEKALKAFDQAGINNPVELLNILLQCKDNFRSEFDLYFNGNYYILSGGKLTLLY